MVMSKMENPLTHYEHDEFTKLVDEKFERLHDEDTRLGKRVTALERTVQQLNALTLSVQKLADNLEQMCKEQTSMRQLQEQESARLKELEDRDGKKWRKMWGYIIPPVITLVLGILAGRLGLTI